MSYYTLFRHKQQLFSFDITETIFVSKSVSDVLTADSYLELSCKKWDISCLLIHPVSA